MRIVYEGLGLAGKRESIASAARILSNPEVSRRVVGAQNRLIEVTGELDGARVEIVGRSGPEGVPDEELESLLASASAVIFVVDTQRERIEANEEWRDRIKAALAKRGQQVAVVQWNKRDLTNALPVAELSQRINCWQAPEFETIASKGIGVIEAFRAALGLVPK
jgi:hypothetical protein